MSNMMNNANGMNRMNGMNSIPCWNIPKNYKPCKKKQYEIHACRPPKNTVVINKLEQAQAVRACKGKTYFTVEELTKNPQLKAFVTELLKKGQAYLVNENTPYVLCGTVGEMWTIAENKLFERYSGVNAEGVATPLTPDKFKENSDGTTKWVRVRTQPNNAPSWACFVPQKCKGVIKTSWGAALAINDPLVKHGLGDFVIAADEGGKPNLNKCYVVNGLIFETTYNNRGWTENLSGKATTAGAVDLPNLGTKAVATATTNGKDWKNLGERNYLNGGGFLISHYFSPSERAANPALNFAFDIIHLDVDMELEEDDGKNVIWDGKFNFKKYAQENGIDVKGLSSDAIMKLAAKAVIEEGENMLSILNINPMCEYTSSSDAEVREFLRKKGVVVKPGGIV